MVRIFILLNFLFLVPFSVYAEPQVTTDVSYYTISGQTTSDLRKQMSAKGPRDPNSGIQVWAKTNWKVQWSVQYNERTNGCQVRGVQTKVILNFVYPQWVDRNRASPTVRAEWDKFYKALVDHEAKHAKHGLYAAHQIEKHLMPLQTRGKCGKFKKSVNERAKGIVRNYANMDVTLDQKTDNGRNEGVVLP